MQICLPDNDIGFRAPGGEDAIVVPSENSGLWGFLGSPLPGTAPVGLSTNTPHGGGQAILPSLHLPPSCHPSTPPPPQLRPHPNPFQQPPGMRWTQTGSSLPGGISSDREPHLGGRARLRPPNAFIGLRRCLWSVLGDTVVSGADALPAHREVTSLGEGGEHVILTRGVR